jgi:nucleoside-diphosphate-sugar epimerase
VIGSFASRSSPVLEWASKIRGHVHWDDGTVEVGDLSLTRDFIDSDSATEAIVEIAFNPRAHGIINLCSGRETSFLEVLTALGRISGKEIRVNESSELKAKVGVRRLVGSVQKLNSVLVRPIEFDLETSLRKLFESA